MFSFDIWLNSTSKLLICAVLCLETDRDDREKERERGGGETDSSLQTREVGRSR